MDSKLFSYLDATRGRVKDASMPYYHTFLHSVMPFILEKGVNVRFEFIYSWDKWPETIKIGDRWNVVYDQYFGQCLSRINRNILVFKSDKEAASFSLRLIAQQAMKSGCYNTAIEAAIASRSCRYNSKFTINEEQNLRHSITLIQEAFVFFHEFYHFYLSFDAGLKEDISYVVRNNLLDKSKTINNYREVPEQAKLQLKNIRQRSTDLLKNEKFVDEMCCDYLAASLIIATYGPIVKSLGVVAQAIDMLFYNIRYMSFVPSITFSIVNRSPVDHASLLMSSTDIQIRHQTIRRSITDISANSSGLISKSSYALWQDAEIIRGIYDKNTDICVDYTISSILSIHENSVNSNKTLSECFEIDNKINFSVFHNNKISDQYEILDALLHGSYT